MPDTEPRIIAQARAFLEQSLLQQPDDPALLVSSGTVAKDLGHGGLRVRAQCSAGSGMGAVG